jgi:hypothetical protein
MRSLFLGRHAQPSSVRAKRRTLAPQRARSSPAACSELKRATSLGKQDHDLRMKKQTREPANPAAAVLTVRENREAVCAALKQKPR